MSPHNYRIEDDPYCYSGTKVFRNFLNIKNPKTLEKQEYRLAAQAQLELLEDTTFRSGVISFGLWKYIHKEIFKDIYPWAGEVRTVRLSKENATFAYPENIEKEAMKVFQALGQENNWQDKPTEYFINKLAHYYAELNAIHPFRDGNGRTQKLLFSEIAHRANHPIDWTKIDYKTHLEAVIASFYGDTRPLEAAIAKAIT